jgi:hypothetical protein
MRNHDRRIELPVFDAYGIWEVASPPAPKLIEVRALVRVLDAHPCDPPSLTALALACRRWA